MNHEVDRHGVVEGGEDLGLSSRRGSCCHGVQLVQVGRLQTTEAHYDLNSKLSFALVKATASMERHREERTVIVV